MIQEYQSVIRELEGLAHDRGLVFDPVVFQITDSDEIAQVASMGLPNRFIHWYWGGTYKELVMQQTKEVFSILELVLNTNPSHAFLRSTNTYLQKVLVIAHVSGHADFFTSNHWYRKSQTRTCGTGRGSTPGLSGNTKSSTAGTASRSSSTLC